MWLPVRLTCEPVGIEKPAGRVEARHADGRIDRDLDRGAHRVAVGVDPGQQGEREGGRARASPSVGERAGAVLVTQVHRSGLRDDRRV